jgi:hypothetical protein
MAVLLPTATSTRARPGTTASSSRKARRRTNRDAITAESSARLRQTVWRNQRRVVMLHTIAKSTSLLCIHAAIVSKCCLRSSFSRACDVASGWRTPVFALFSLLVNDGDTGAEPTSMLCLTAALLRMVERLFC